MGRRGGGDPPSATKPHFPTPGPSPRERGGEVEAIEAYLVTEFVTPAGR